MRGEAPFASHLLYTQPDVFDDANAYERMTGMHAGWSWMGKADLVAVYKDRGISRGMSDGIANAKKLSIPIEYRSLPL